MPLRFLFSSVSGYGHLHPLIPLARALQDAGHQVAYATREFVRPRIASAGLDFLPVGSDRELDPEYQAFKQQRDTMPVNFASELVIYNRLFVGIGARLMVPGLVEMARRWQPDVIIREGGEYGSLIAAEHLGLPHATVAFTTALKGMSVLEQGASERLDSIRAMWGLHPDPALESLYRYLYLSYCPPSFSTHEVGAFNVDSDIPATTHFIRPQFFDNTHNESLPAWVEQLSDQPTVYLTLGTEVNNEPDLYPRVMQTLITGLRDLPINLIVTLGRGKDPSDFGPQPDNIHIAQYIPQTLLLPHCDLMVMHAGSNSLLEAIDVGLPLLLVPLIADQFFNAHIAQNIHLAQVVQLDDLTPERIRAAAVEVLNNPVYRQTAARLQNEMHTLPDQMHAIALLEQLATTRAPIPNLQSPISTRPPKVASFLISDKIPTIMILTGKVWKYGDNVNTDVIFPGKYTYTITDPNEQAKHALEDLDPNFARGVQHGDMIVGGKNWGHGSSREQAVGALKHAGITAIIAKSFARIYFRNAVNNGLLPIVCPAAVDAIENGETITLDLDAHTVHTNKGIFDFPPLSPSLVNIIESGGLIQMLRKKFGTEHLPMPEMKGGE